jgi:signal peptidase II
LQKKYIIVLAITLPVILMDQLTKAWIIAALPLHDAHSVIDGFFNIIHVRNPGAAFGFLAGAAPVFRSIFFVAVTLAAILLILHYLRTAQSEEFLLVGSLALILAGAVGNLIDRVRFGEVVDFLDVYIGTHHWPAFNVADAAISSGACTLAILLFARRNERTEEHGSKG